MNEHNALVAAERGLLARYGIDVQGTPEAIAELGRMLADRPVGEALVLIAEQGRKHGVRLFRSARFDEQPFMDDAARLGLREAQAQAFVRNLAWPGRDRD